MKSLNILLLFFNAVILPVAHATIEVGTTIKVQSEVPAWRNSFKAKVETKKALTECRETQEIQGTFLCQSHKLLEMNMALTRASFFVEGNNGKPGVIVPINDPTFLDYLQQIGGHDLKGEDLIKYQTAAVEACDKDKNLCPSDLEKELFEEFIIPKAKAHPNFIIITFSLLSHMSWRDVVTHEILHAQYFADAKYRQITDDFWANEMTEKEKQVVRQGLSQYYDTRIELLMKNEFQAYMLMTGAEFSQLGDLVSKYRQPLLDRLAAVGLRPIQVE